MPQILIILHQHVRRPVFDEHPVLHYLTVFWPCEAIPPRIVFICIFPFLSPFPFFLPFCRHLVPCLLLLITLAGPAAGTPLSDCGPGLGRWCGQPCFPLPGLWQRSDKEAQDESRWFHPARSATGLLPGEHILFPRCPPLPKLESSDRILAYMA